MSRRISLLVSDVDGTLVTGDKRLTQPTIDAALRLQRAGVKLSLVSSRPPAGFAMLVGPMQLESPIGAFNGGAILNPDFSVIEETHVPPDAARTALEAFAEFGVEGWVFTKDTWYARSDRGDYVPKERRTIQREPQLVDSFEPHLEAIGKLVGSSQDFEAVAACEAALEKRLVGRASAKRSQPYYLDVTPYGFDKGEAVQRIAKVLTIPLDEVAVIGDMSNDMPMFKIAAHRIAMGNGINALKRIADFVTDDNENDGWATAIDRFVLPRAALAA